MLHAEKHRSQYLVSTKDVSGVDEGERALQSGILATIYSTFNHFAMSTCYDKSKQICITSNFHWCKMFPLDGIHIIWLSESLPSNNPCAIFALFHITSCMYSIVSLCAVEVGCQSSHNSPISVMKESIATSYQIV